MFQDVITESKEVLQLDVHFLEVETAKAFLCIALKDLLVRSSIQASQCKPLRLVTGQARHGRRKLTAEGRGMFAELQQLLVECRFRLSDFRPLPGGGAFFIEKTSLQRWMRSLLSSLKMDSRHMQLSSSINWGAKIDHK